MLYCPTTNVLPLRRCAYYCAPCQPAEDSVNTGTPGVCRRNACRRHHVTMCCGSLLGPVVASFRALSGRLKFTVRRHKCNKDALLCVRLSCGGIHGYSSCGTHLQSRHGVCWIWRVSLEAPSRMTSPRAWKHPSSARGTSLRRSDRGTSLMRNAHPPKNTIGP